MAVRDITYVGEGLIPAPLDGSALRYALLPKDAVTDIAIHHWTGWTPPETWTANEEIAYIRRIDEYHRTGRGLDGIAYHLCPFPSGRLYITSRLDCYGAGVYRKNNCTLHLALPGSFRSHVPSPRHLAATVEAVQFAYDYLERDVPTTPHSYWGGTTCPGERWPEWVPQLRAAALQEDDMAKLDAEDRKYLSGLMRAVVRAVATGVFSSPLQGDPNYTEAEHDLMEVLREVKKIPAVGGGPTVAQTKQAVKDALKEGTD